MAAGGLLAGEQLGDRRLGLAPQARLLRRPARAGAAGSWAGASRPWRRGLRLPDPQISVARFGDQLRLRAARPAKGVWLEAGDQVAWSDNFVDLLPEDETVVTALGLGDATPAISWLGQDEPR